MDLPPHNDKNWPTLHGRFRDFLKALNNADPTTHVAIKTAMYVLDGQSPDANELSRRSSERGLPVCVLD